MIVHIQAVGKTADVFQRADDRGLYRIARSLEFGRLRAIGPEPLELFPNGVFQLLRLDARLPGRLDHKDGTQCQRKMLRMHVLRDSFFVHQALVQTAGFASSENSGDQVAFGVVLRKYRVRDPCQVDAGQFHLVSHNRALFGRDCGDRNRRTRDRLSRRYRAKVFLHKFPGL